MGNQLHKRARELFDVAVRAADPARALRAAMAGLPPVSGRNIVIALGKAACPMAQEALHLLAGQAVTALAVTNPENLRPVAGCRVLPGGHPLPDANSAAAGAAVVALLETATEGDRVLVLVSGGGSALLVAPVAGISLADKVATARLLLEGGFDITEMNMVRQHLSRLKGGGLARLAAPAEVRGFILSDVIGDDLRVIASGPTVAPIASRRQARQLLQDRGVFTSLPASVQKVLQTESPAAPVQAENTLIGSNRQSLEALRDASGGIIVSDALVGDVAEAADFILRAAQENPTGTLIFGGETTVRITGTGKGGRNQELALRMALRSAEIPGDWVFLSGGTDGRDGPTDAAGGIIDPDTIARIPDATARLANNDSYRALQQAGALLMTGGTGTNVADVQILLRNPQGNP